MKIIFLFAALSTAAMVIIVPTLINALLFFISCLVFGSIYILMTGLELFALYYLIVYVGAIMVLFLFVILMAHKEHFVPVTLLTHPVSMALIITALLVVAEVLLSSYNVGSVEGASMLLATKSHYNDYALGSAGVSTILLLTKSLFEYYGVVVFWVGFLLFLSMVGAISICFPGSARVKRQDTVYQVTKRSGDSLKVVKIPGKSSGEK